MLFLNKDIPEGTKIGESWEVSTFGDDISIVSNGEYKGWRLTELLKENGGKILGKRFVENEGSQLPLLLKFIDAGQTLSLQVHPDEDVASKIGKGAQAKTEAWFIIDAEPNSRIAVGLKKDITIDEFKKILKNPTKEAIENCLNFVQVQRGDVIYNPAGTVHSIGGGILLCEIQEASDTTFRIYDYGRTGVGGTPRPLHIREAIDAIKESADWQLVRNRDTCCKSDATNLCCTTLLSSRHFSIESLEFEKEISEGTDTERFFMYSVLEGKGSISFQDGKKNIEFLQGESILVPASLEELTLVPLGKCYLLKFYI